MRLSRFIVLPAILIVACNTTGKKNESTVNSATAPVPEVPAPALCTQNAECGDGTVCSSAGACVTPVIDGVKDPEESDVDCGSPTTPKCGDNKTCREASNCNSGICTNGLCAVPSPTDGVKNGDESDVDCGGKSAPACALGQGCATKTDCISNACSYQKKCIERPSCAPHFGGDTCGPGEPDDANAKHESCCTALPLPMSTGTVQMDKYHITAGRMRAFLDAVDGNVRKFVKEHRPAGWDPTWDNFVPNGWDVDPTIPSATDPEMLKRYHSSVWHQLGGTALLNKLGRDGKPFQYGCFIQGNGTHTYRMPDDVQIDTLKDIPAKYSQDVLDAKALNCVTALMLMAFCEWDWPGSSLPTWEETRFAWHKGQPDLYKYPWGNSPAPVGYLYEGDYFGPNSGIPEPSGKYGPYAVIPPDAQGLTGSDEYANWKYSYAYPSGNPAAFFPDFSAYISAPGRFPKGNGPFGHSDLAGNVFDLTSSISGTAGQHPDDREVTWGRNGAWEGHNIPFAAENGPWTAPIMRKYGKAGGRCAKK